MAAYRNGNPMGGLGMGGLGMGSFNMDAVLKFTDLTPQIQQHLSKVYGTLAAMLAAASLGVMAHLHYGIGGTMSTLACFLMMMVIGMQQDKHNTPKRIALVTAFGFFKGASIGPLCEVSLQIDPTLMLVAFLATTAIFACFTVASLLAKRRSMLFLGGTLSSIMFYMFLASLVNMFVRSPLLMDVQVYFGLFVFCAYVMFDTQMIVEKAANGQTDFAWHALELFVDFVAIFVRILIILMKNSQKKEKKRSNNRR
jgi:FtsH-binding integral membrane protein